MLAPGCVDQEDIDGQSDDNDNDHHPNHYLQHRHHHHIFSFPCSATIKDMTITPTSTIYKQRRKLYDPCLYKAINCAFFSRFNSMSNFNSNSNCWTLNSVEANNYFMCFLIIAKLWWQDFCKIFRNYISPDILWPGRSWEWLGRPGQLPS